MEVDILAVVERLGSLGLLGWLLGWATGTLWPRLSAHLDSVNAKLDRIGDQLSALRGDICELQSPVGAGPVPAHKAPSPRADTGSAPTRSRRRAAAATGGGT